MFQPTAMHIPDGFLSTQVSWLFWVLVIPVIIVALIRVNKELGEREVPVMGVLAAAIFAGQMLNFAVAGGTSGHLMGAALATILLGPWAAILVLTAVVSVQALIFQDGGLVVMGANLFNMAVVGSLVATFVYSMFRYFGRGSRTSIFLGGFSAGWASIFLSSLLVALQLSLSGTTPANIAIPIMGGVHILIGIGEGLITLGALSFIYAARPDLLKVNSPRQGSSRWVWIGGFVITLALAVLSPIASSNPDGLEWAAIQAGFIKAAQKPAYTIIPDYVLPGVNNQTAATILAGVIGAAIVFGVVLLMAYTRRKRAEA